MHKAFTIWLIGLLGFLIGIASARVFPRTDPQTGLAAAQVPAKATTTSPVVATIDVSRVKCVAFDNFGTVYDMSKVPREEVRDYIQQVRRPEWAELTLPDSWLHLKAFPDSVAGIKKISRHYTVVACSNADYNFLRKLARNNNFEWSLVIPLETIPAYKPDPRCYKLIAELTHYKPEEILIVTGNEGSPDLTVPKELGMQTIRIRGTEGPKDLLELAELLGCGDE